ncbi:LysR family transcriptional regulator [Pandoraea apista]|uniref:LysR family transcriptional regulator n=1 Tax=Pandoraea apista TaxID=93218 RepID=A0A5E5PBF7_9BURK|nr:LysR family transcriptional regulator [Pandoraea apista]AVF40917.1 LysR family transcriptional regulator [Pandoraea apista]OXS88528.1 LysR family transcriptional regulator [Pandoraea apista]VVG73640.1 LysR family transcriptional regulator [Pandoraea apista]
MEYPDLNFLYVVEALMAERSVSRAAQRLGLTQPAVSHALSRLRTRFGDDLFVRAGAVMAPTPTGERVADGVARALALIRQDVLDARAFDPADTRRTFSVCLSDMGMIVLLPRLLAALAEHAPMATLRPIQVPAAELGAALQDGELDLAIGYLDRMGEHLHQQRLFTRSLVGIRRASASKRDKGEGAARMDAERFMNTRHVVAATLAMTNELLAKELRKRGTRLNVGVEVPYLLAVPSLVANSDFIAVIPNELADLFGKMAHVDAFDLPIALPDLTVRQFWHPRFHNDAAHRWFRKLVAEALR